MASFIACLPSPPLVFHERKTLFNTLPKHAVSPIKEKQNYVAGILVKAAGESSESSTSISIVESVQTVWESEDKFAFVGLGFAVVVAVWASASLISAVDKLPLIPNVLEFIGILYSSWFVYRYLLFKPDREELIVIINKSASDILGQ